jgi:hypothetical protein
LEFNKHGEERNTMLNTSARRLMAASAAHDLIAQMDSQRARNAAACEIERFLQGFRNVYNGIVEVSADNKHRLIEIVNSL